jgi:type IV secretion system protein TrbC
MQRLSILIFSVILMFMVEPALAAAQTNLPWEGPLEMIRDSITGPVAMVISLLGVTVAGGMLIFGGEMGEFTRRVIMLVLVLGLLISASGMIELLFGANGALVG